MSSNIDLSTQRKPWGMSLLPTELCDMIYDYVAHTLLDRGDENEVDQDRRWPKRSICNTIQIAEGAHYFEVSVRVPDHYIDYVRTCKRFRKIVRESFRGHTVFHINSQDSETEGSLFRRQIWMMMVLGGCNDPDMLDTTTGVGPAPLSGEELHQCQELCDLFVDTVMEGSRKDEFWALVRLLLLNVFDIRSYQGDRSITVKNTPGGEIQLYTSAQFEQDMPGYSGEGL